jgi:hypothetical protein
LSSETYPAEGSDTRFVPRAPVREGDVLDGKFEIGATLGVGGMGVVVAARHRELGKMVALKFLLREDGGLVARFLREARAAAQLTSEHTTRVIDVGRLASGTPYLVMEYLRGESLAAWITRSAPASAEDAVDWILQACEGLAEAHGRGIVHRDLKPANLFLSERADGSVCLKILDFGISKVAAEMQDDPGLTTTGSVLGSPSFASPEQLTHPRSVDARADVWALGVTLYQLLTGARPFEGETLPTLYMRILAEAPLRPDDRRNVVPRALADVVMRCLEKEAALRFADVVALAMALEPFAPARARGASDRVRAALAAATRVRSDAAAAATRAVLAPDTIASAPDARRVAREEEATREAPRDVTEIGSPAIADVTLAASDLAAAPQGSRRFVVWSVVACGVVGVVTLGLVGGASPSPASARASIDAVSSAITSALAVTAPATIVDASAPSHDAAAAASSSSARAKATAPRPAPTPKRDPRSYR